MAHSLILAAVAQSNAPVNPLALQAKLMQKYPGVQLEYIDNPKRPYCLGWQLQEQGTCVMEGYLHKDSTAVTIAYCSFPREPLAELLVWLRDMFPPSAIVLLCDEEYSFSLPLPPDVDEAEVADMLEQVGW